MNKTNYSTVDATNRELMGTILEHSKKDYLINIGIKQNTRKNVGDDGKETFEPTNTRTITLTFLEKG